MTDRHDRSPLPRQTWTRRFTDWAKQSETAGPVFLAILIGAGAGLASVTFHWLIGRMHVLFDDQLGSSLSAFFGSAYHILVVALGGLLVGLIVRFLSPDVKGHGVPEVMVAVGFHGGYIPLKASIYRALAAAVCLGSGGSGGPEGPIVQIGAGVGSSVGRWFRLNDRRVILSVACGAAGGIAATFNAPIAGVIFALEVILARFSALSFGIVVLSSITATVTQRIITHTDTPAFTIFATYALASAWELPLYALLGVLSALVAQGFTRTLYLVEDMAERTRVPNFIKPALGGALVGLIGILDPRVFSTGYATIESALSGSLTAKALLLLCALKIICTSLSVGSGGSVGVFAPSLFIGAMFGGVYGQIIHALFPTVTSEHGAYSLVGMAAVFAGSAHAPITAVLMLFEMTDSYELILPLMTAAVISLFVSQRISPDSIYTLKLRRQGIDVRAVQDIDLMDSITVGDAMEKNFETVPERLPLTALIMKFAARFDNGYPVLDDKGLLVGVVTTSDVTNAVIDENPDTMTVGDICARNVIVIRPEQSLSTALTQFGAHNVRRLPVVDPESPGKVIGMLGSSDIVSAYIRAYHRKQEFIQKSDQMSELRETSKATISREVIKSDSLLAGKLVKDARFPTGSTLITILRGNETIVPSGATTLRQGDQLMVLSNRETARAVKDWLQEHC